MFTDAFALTQDTVRATALHLNWMKYQAGNKAAFCVFLNNCMSIPRTVFIDCTLQVRGIINHFNKVQECAWVCVFACEHVCVCNLE